MIKQWWVKSHGAAIFISFCYCFLKYTPWIVSLLLGVAFLLWEEGPQGGSGGKEMQSFWSLASTCRSGTWKGCFGTAVWDCPKRSVELNLANDEEVHSTRSVAISAEGTSSHTHSRDQGLRHNSLDMQRKLCPYDPALRALLTCPQVPSPKIKLTQVRLKSRHLSAFSSESVKEVSAELTVASCVWQILSKACEVICILTRYLQMEKHRISGANKPLIATIHCSAVHNVWLAMGYYFRSLSGW